MYVYEWVSFPDLKIERFHQKILGFWLSLKNQISGFPCACGLSWLGTVACILHFFLISFNSVFFHKWLTSLTYGISQVLKHLGFSPCSKVPVSEECSSPCMYYVSLGLFLPPALLFLTSFSVVLKPSFSSFPTLFLPKFLHFLIFLTLTFFLYHPPHNPVPPNKMNSLNQICLELWALAGPSSPALHQIYEKLGHVSTFGTWRVLNGWWLRTPLFCWEAPLRHRVFKEA